MGIPPRDSILTLRAASSFATGHHTAVGRLRGDLEPPRIKQVDVLAAKLTA